MLIAYVSSIAFFISCEFVSLVAVVHISNILTNFTRIYFRYMITIQIYDYDYSDNDL